jgi:hypothetical protein
VQRLLPQEHHPRVGIETLAVHQAGGTLLVVVGDLDIDLDHAAVGPDLDAGRPVGAG